MDGTSRALVIGASTSLLFDLRSEEEVLRSRGFDAYRRYLADREGDALADGPGLPLIQALLRLNRDGQRRVEIVAISSSPADASLRFLCSAEQRGLELASAAFSGGRPLAPYLAAFGVDLFLSGDAAEVQAALEAGGMAALCQPGSDPDERFEPLRIALDGDAAGLAREASRDGAGREAAGDGLPAGGPFERVARALAGLQAAADAEHPPLRTALATSRRGPELERVLHALRRWELRLDEAFFLGELPRQDALRAFAPHLLLGSSGGPRPAVAAADAAPRLPRTEVATDDADDDEKEGGLHALASPFGRMRFRSND